MKKTHGKAIIPSRIKRKRKIRKHPRMIAALSISRFSKFLILLVFLAPFSCFAAGQLLDVRVGSHHSFDRIVCELSGPAEYQLIEPANGNLELLFRAVETKPNFNMPALPRGITIISGLGIRRDEPDNLILIIGTRFDADVATSVLSGNTWRIVLDIQKSNEDSDEDASHPVEQTTPEYVPGDRPIETRYAESDTGASRNTTEVVSPALPDSNTDAAHFWSVLAHYYFSLGDTHSAALFKDCYEAESDKSLDVAIPDEVRVAETRNGSNKITWWLFLSAFIAGLTAGFAVSRRWLLSLFARIRSFVRREKISVEPVAETMEQDIKNLEKAVTREKGQPVAAPALEIAKATHEKSTPETATEAQEEDIIKESLMDRRVRRVLELHKAGSDIASIAKELEMGQDEVKLILDLNQ
jgi:hypothetical protein